MTRRLLNLLTGLSLLLCVAACVLWVRSHRGGATLTWAGGGRWRFVTVYPGYLIAGDAPDPSGSGGGVRLLPRAIEWRSRGRGRLGRTAPPASVTPLRQS